MDKYRSYFAEPVDISYFLSVIQQPEKSRLLPLEALKEKYTAKRIPEVEPPVEIKPGALDILVGPVLGNATVDNTVFATALKKNMQLTTAMPATTFL